MRIRKSNLMSAMAFRAPRLKPVPVAAGTSVLLTLALVSGFWTPASADRLDDRKNSLEREISQIEQSIEFLDEDIAQTTVKLRGYQKELPGAQRELAEAEGRVEAATREVNALAQRVELAQETKGKITDQLERDKDEMEQTRRIIGQIATQAYKNGGVPTDISLIFGAGGTANLTSSIDMVDQALRSQNAAMDRLSQQNAANVNSEARLVAIEAEITDLKAKADAALAAEQQARDEAAAQKARVDRLIKDTSALSSQLKAKKPVIQAKLSRVEAAHKKVQADIAERQRRLIEQARQRELARQRALAAERARIENARRAAEAARQNRPAPPPVKPAPVTAPRVGSPSAFGLRFPVSAPVTSGFGWRPTPAGTVDWGGAGGYTHTGIDFGAGCGTPVYAASSGQVWYADSHVLAGAGNRVVLNHGVRQGNALATNYYHLARYVVYPGQSVGAGQLIGYVGSTGNSTGCHLHFETMLNGSLVDPLGLL
jgi:murein DD-endopeptidase MepM/ murein hydrolase activator NlpD